MEENNQIIELLSNYRNEIKRVTSESKTNNWSVYKLCSEIEKITNEIDTFINSYQELKKVKKQFEYLTLNIINSLSPVQSKFLNENLESSNSFSTFDLNNHTC